MGTRGLSIGLPARFLGAFVLSVVGLVLAAVPAAAAHTPVPDVVGRPRGEAMTTLGDAGFLVATIEVAGTPPDTVASQEPAAGVGASPGSVVTLFVRRSVAVATTAPTAVGLSVVEANAALGSVYLLRLQQVSGGGADRGKVVQQDPAAGASLDFRGTLTLRFVPDPAVPPLVVVPDLQGLSAADAQAEAGRAGLHARVATAALAGAPPDVVIAQRPGPGTQLARYATVDVVVSTGGGGTPPAPSQVPVPNLIDMTEAAARSDLDAAGLDAETEWVAGDATRAFLVDAQAPAPGQMVEAGSTVRLRIVRYSLPTPPTPTPPEHAVVPNLIHRTQPQADAMLAAVGLYGNPVLLPHPGGIPFRVFGQQTVPGSVVPVGTTVTYRVAKPSPPPAPVPVPNFWMKTKSHAISLAALAGLDLEVQEIPNPAHPHGRVFAQSVPAGTTVALGTLVKVKVAKHPPGPSPGSTTVPQLFGKTAGQANVALAAAGLSPAPQEVVAPAKPPFKVFQQSPPAGASVSTGDVVHYKIAKPVGGVTVPNLFGKTQGQAGAALALSGLVGDVDHVVTNAHPAGKVFAQLPSAGASVPAGSVVHVKIAQAAATVTVPNLIGLSKAQATLALAAKGLAANPIQQLVFWKPPHKVYSQTPIHGASVPAGSTVTFKHNP